MSGPALLRLGGIGAALFVLQLISMGAMEMSGPFWPILIRDLAPDDASFSIASTAVYIGPMLGIALSSTFWGRLGDRYGHRMMMIRALGGLAATQFAIGLSSDIWMIVALRVLQGAIAGYIAPAQAYGARMTDPAQRGQLFAWLQIATNTGSLAGAVLGGVILDTATFATINFAAATLCGLCAVAVAVWLPRPTRQAALAPVPAPDSPKWFMPSVPVGAIHALTGLLLVGRLVLTVPFALYMTGVFGASARTTGLAYGLLALGFVMSASIWANVLRARSAATVINTVAFIAVGCAVITWTAGTTTSITAFCALYLLWGALLGGTTPVLVALVSAHTSAGSQGAVLGGSQTIQQGASVFGIAVGAWTAQQFGPGSVFPLAATFYTASAIAAGLLAFRLRRQWLSHPHQGDMR